MSCGVSGNPRVCLRLCLRMRTANVAKVVIKESGMERKRGLKEGLASRADLGREMME